ncbi:unnamed protein product [Pleuronectes platessa]|uniref:Uncharacterized protein n=1 Tax=Pleuronectes platessa TaxID=8262 RepID=A0A9N7YZ78_PLEPL|nr:unnamed protein product [Pleuronectes platessa]
MCLEKRKRDEFKAGGRSLVVEGEVDAGLGKLLLGIPHCSSQSAESAARWQWWEFDDNRLTTVTCCLAAKMAAIREGAAEWRRRVRDAVSKKPRDIIKKEADSEESSPPPAPSPLPPPPPPPPPGTLPLLSSAYQIPSAVLAVRLESAPVCSSPLLYKYLSGTFCGASSVEKRRPQTPRACA